MPSLKTTVNQTYPAATLRVYRSLQIGQHPNQEDAKRAAQVAEDILSDPQSSHTSSETVETPVMSAAVRLALVHRWIEATQGWLRLRASYTAGRPYDAVSILILAESCEWARLTDISGLPDVQQGKMHPVCLELGVGSCRAAYQHDKSSDARVYFFTAYRA